METNIDGQSTWSRMVAHWQPAVLVTACVAGGLTLTMMVIGSTPDVVVQASRAAIEAAPVDTVAPDAPVVTEVVVDTEVPVDTAVSTDSTESIDPAATAGAAPAAPGMASTAQVEPVTVATPAPGPAPAVPNATPAAAPTTGLQSAPATAPVTSAPTAPVTVVVPQATAAPTTAAPPPAPTTAAPPPTTVAPVAAALTYPSFSAGSAATVVLQFDGSSIYVASVTRQTNWVSEVDKNGPRTVEIKFFNTATQRDEEFHATVENGRIKVEN